MKSGNVLLDRIYGGQYMQCKEKKHDFSPSGLLLLRFLLIYSGSCLVVKSCPTLMTQWTVARQVLCPWDLSSKNTGVDCHFLLQAIFPTQDWTGISCIGRQILYCWATREPWMCLNCIIAVFARREVYCWNGYQRIQILRVNTFISHLAVCLPFVFLSSEN